MKNKKFSAALVLLFFSASLLFLTLQCKNNIPDDDPDDPNIQKPNLPGSSKVNNAGYVPVNFFYEWEPGIPDGIPKAEIIHKTINAADYGNGTIDATNAINAAIQSAGAVAGPNNRQVVQLSAGKFFADNSLILNRSNVVLRGAGTSTVIIGKIRPAGAIVIGRETPENIFSSTALTKVVDLTANAFTGDTKITVADVLNFRAGDMLMLDRRPDDNGDPNGNLGGTNWRTDQVGGSEWRKNNIYQVRKPDGDGQDGPNTTDGSYRTVRQYIEIFKIEGNTLHLTNKINIDFPLTLNPQVWNTTANNYQYIGLEDMKVETSFASWNNNASIHMTIASSYCWVKNVESDGSAAGRSNPENFEGVHLRMKGFRNVVTGSYVHDSFNNAAGGNGYGIDIQGTSGLIDNNIADKLCKPMLASASGGGNVIAYNFVPNTETSPVGNQETAIDTSHGSYSHSDLYEGNFAANISTDSTWGNNGQMVFFRNHAWGRNLDRKTTDNLRAVHICGWSNEHALIGNVWLSPGGTTIKEPNAVLWDNYQNNNAWVQVVYRIGSGGWDRVDGDQYRIPYDPYPGLPNGWAMSKLYRNLEFDYVRESIFKNPNPVKEIEASELPPSFYLADAPDYFSGYVWPPVNPGASSHETRVIRLPAKDRYDNKTYLP